MDLPPFHHHQHRYVQRPPTFSDNPSFFNHHAPPPPPYIPNIRPPPPPPPYHHHTTHRPLPPPPPTPPPYHLQSQFSYPSRPLQNRQFFDFAPNCSPPPPPPRVSSWADRAPRSISHPQPPPPPHPHDINFPFDDFGRSEVERNSPRFIRDDYREPLWGRKDVDMDRDNDKGYFESVYEKSMGRRIDVDANLPRDIRSSVTNFELRRDRYEDQRWEFDNVDEASRRMECDHDQGRYDRRLREGIEEFHRSPRKKQVQKKSALLRIQYGKGNNRNKNQDQHFSRGSFDESSAGDSRGKEKDVFERLERRIEERERSPVELDVSFKSNALVAKAIMTHSKPAVASDKNVTPRNKKIRKTNPSGSAVTKSSEHMGTSDNSANGSDSRLSTDKESKHLVDKVTVFIGGSACNSTSTSKESKYVTDDFTVSVGGSASATVPSSNGANGLMGSKSKESPKMTDLHQGNNHVGCDGTPLCRIRKKAKLRTPIDQECIPMQTKVGVEPGNAVDLVTKPSSLLQLDEDVIHSVELTTYDRTIAVNSVVLEVPSNESIVGEIDIPSKYGVVSGDESSNSKRKKINPSEILASSSLADSEIKEFADYTSSSVLGCPSVLNSETSIFGVKTGTTSSTMDEAGVLVQCPSQDGLQLSVDGLVKESAKGISSVQRRGDAVLSSTEDSKIDKCGVDISIKDACMSLVSKLGFSNGIENAAADIGSSGARSEEQSSPQGTILPTDIEKGLGDSFLVGNDTNLASSQTERIIALEGLLSADRLNSCLRTPTNFYSDGTAVGNDSGPVTGSCGDSRKQTCIDGIMFQHEIRHAEESPNAAISIADDTEISVDGDFSHKVIRKRKTSSSQSVLPNLKKSEMHVHTLSSLNGEGAYISCLRNDHASGEKEAIVPSNGEDSVNGHSSHEGPSEVELSLQEELKVCTGFSANSLKKRKVSSTRLTSSISSVNHEGLASVPNMVPSNGDVSIATFDSPNDLSDIHDGPSAGPPPSPLTILLENGTTKDKCQHESFGDGVKDHFSEPQQAVACNSQLGAAEKETSSSVFTDNQFGSTNMVKKVSMNCASIEIGQRSVLRDRECQIYVNAEDNIPLSKNLSLFADSDCISAFDASINSMESVPDILTLVSSPEELPNSSKSDVAIVHSPFSDMVNNRDKQINENHVSAGDSVSCPVKTSSETSKFGADTGTALGGVPLTNANSLSSLSQNIGKVTQNMSSGKSNLSKNQQTSASASIFPGRSSASFITSRNVAISNHTKKPLTWRRSGNGSASVTGRGSQTTPIPPPHSYIPNAGVKVQNSYIRKGNSLVRKPSPVGSSSQGYHSPSSSVYRLNSSGMNNMKKKSENRLDTTNSPRCTGTVGLNAPSEKQKIPLLSQPLSCTMLNLGKSTSLPDIDHSRSANLATKPDPLELRDTMEVLKLSDDPSTSSAVPECQVSSTVNSDCQSIDEGNDSVEIRNILGERNSGKKIVYVKKRSNQLIAASDKAQTSADGYYKRRKNQLIRASVGNHMKQRVVTDDGNLNSQKLGAEKIVPIRHGTKRHTALAKTYKWSKFSLVWTLGDSQSSRRGGSAIQYEKVRPNLFPWKRTTYRRSIIPGSTPNDSSISTIRRKLLLSRKRETIYRRSTHGLSLQRSKVLSVGGSSLKWSKSIDRSSKKANEAATLAVASVQKRKRGQDSYNFSTDSMRGNNVSRERIFRIGCERYKMDPSGKTLQRISGDEEPSVSAVPEAKKSYIPKRLLIGNDEYVRIGSGNKLVRNPKRRARILASEKVRWSLHTARLRLARKKKYCQFFTRFGKCNKDNGKCPYIHDPSKIAVCTKFLNGSCSDSNCKLTHEVIPERMSDCSYFLQGTCSNENCHYRHVNVNSKSSICEGFLRGYCADGNECRKKHTYVCPVFEATGNCPQGSKCKLHHPNNRRKGVKRKASSNMKNGQGRYFGSPHNDTAEHVTTGLEKVSVKGNDDDIFFKEGRFVDFISLDVSEEEEHTIDLRSEGTPTCFHNDQSDMQVDDIDDLIKPMRLINRYQLVDSSPVIGSPSDMTTSYVSEESHSCK